VAGCGDEGADAVAVNAEESAEAEEGTVHLDSAALALSGVIVDSVTRVDAGALPVTGRITYDQDRVSHIGPKTQGRVVELMAEEGSRVDAGQVLAHLESPEVGSIRAELHEAEALLGIARENFEREQRLEAQGISSRREVLYAEAEYRREQARLRSAEERLRVLGASLHGDGGHFDVTSPYEGVVVQRHAGRGEVMGPSDQLFTVADLTRLWIELDIYERDLVRVREGQDVQVTTAAWSGRTFRGTIVYVGDILDAERRTVRARVEVENDDEALKPGMFATALIRMAEDGPGVLAVPSDAVQTVEGSTVVWVPGDEPGEFVVRPVQVGLGLPAGLVEITAGLRAGDRLVVEGAFTLKSELAKGEFGGHGH
jgi:cobalt-zinc-cadmium efflux system membrane fusion protein